MTIEDRIATLKQARTLVAEAGAGSNLPQLETILADVDMHLHWALWNLGEPVSLRPELEP